MTDAPPPVLQSAVLSEARGVSHGFFTREGGVSTGQYAGLNVGYGSRDDRDSVAENRRRAMAVFGLDGAALTTVHQVHSADVIKVAAPWGLAERPKADAMVTDRPGVALGILTADCGPVLFADAEAGVAAAAHAGWKGALGGVLEATVEAMEQAGARRDRIAASLGPCIAQPSYEVGPEFVERFLAADLANQDFFVPSGRTGHALFDLPGYVMRRLEGIGLAACDRIERDTQSDPERFYSYRRARLSGEDDYGRLLSTIMLAG